MEHSGSATVLEGGASAKNTHDHRHQDEPVTTNTSVALRNENDAATMGTITHPDKPDTRWRVEVILRGTISKFLSGAHK
jgi:hypothetical protein